MSRPPPLLISSSAPEVDTLPLIAHCILPNVSSRMVTSLPKLTTDESVLPLTLQKDASKAGNITTSVLSASPPPMEHRSALSSFEFTCTPLHADAFASALSDSCLNGHYPTLVHHIINGFLISLDMPSISENFIPPNHYKTAEEDEIIQTKLKSEVVLGHMSGPFTVEQAELFFSGPFRTAPLAIVPKPGVSLDHWHMVQNLSFRDRFGMSVWKKGWEL
jgi:hypothetical protein